MKEPRYIITEYELKSFHLAAVLASGKNKVMLELVDKIRSRKISEDCGTHKTQSNTTNNAIACPWANDSECENVNIKCHECIRDPLLQHRKDYAVVAQQH